MSDYTFETPEPIDLFVEIGSGSIQLQATETSTSQVAVEGAHADDVRVTQNGRHIRIVGPKSFRNKEREIHVQVELPTGSDLTTQVGSADLTATGRYGRGRLRSGSGSLSVDAFTGHLAADTGSGEITVGEVGQELRAKTGSGDVEVRQVGGGSVVSTGSGDVRLGQLGGDAVLRTGSGQLEVAETGPSTSLSAGSGDLRVGAVRQGELHGKTGSGDISVGVQFGTPVWADVRSTSGSVRNDLPPAGAPAEGQPYIDLRLRTGSGDIALRPL